MCYDKRDRLFSFAFNMHEMDFVPIYLSYKISVFVYFTLSISPVKVSDPVIS